MRYWVKINKPECLVSSDGEIYKFERNRSDRLQPRPVFNGSYRKLKPYISNTGYYYISINKHPYSVHSLVARAFLGSRPASMQIDHKDRNRPNNCASNLRYVTPRENILNRDYVEFAKIHTGFFKTMRNGKCVYLPESERKKYNSTAGKRRISQ